MSATDVEKHQIDALRPSKLANPGALGLFSFASTTFVLSIFNVSARGIHTPNAVVGMAIFTGGLVQILAGMWEYPRGNTLGATAFTSYGSFWMSYATILIPSSNIIASYKTPAELHNALGIYLIAWFMVTFLFFIASLKKNVSMVALFFFLTLTFLLLAIGEFMVQETITKGGGALGIVTAFIAFYVGTSDLLGNDSLVAVPLGKIA